MRPLLLISSLTTALLFTTAALAQDFAKSPKPAQVVSTQTFPEHKRLRIGVALEGGGALGEAHIGVLKWFEEHHIPVDYLAGTSMGGLVGVSTPQESLPQSFTTSSKSKIGRCSSAGQLLIRICRFGERKTPERSRMRSRLD
jgi:predicted acylesterase/phospholipase RssA